MDTPSDRVRRLAPLGLLVVLLAAGGCSKNPPCATDPSQIDAARSEVETATTATQGAKTELSSAEERKAELQRQLAALPEQKELEAKLDEVKKGSGR